jgi:tetratricopeptide (TPR) repeat protein
MLFTAMAFEKLGEPVKAEDLYTAILKQYPYSRYLGEAYVKLGRLKKLGRNEDLEAGLRALQQDQNQRGLETVRKALAQTKACLDFLTKAIKEDPCSVWAGYAKQDLAAEQVYIENKRPLIRAVAHDQEIERMLSDVLEQTVS